MTDLHKQLHQSVESQQDTLAKEIVKRQYARSGKCWEPDCKEGHQKSIRDIKYHLDYLSQAVAAHSPTLFKDYTAWVRVLFARLNFSAEVLPTTLVITRQVLEEYLSPELFDLVRQYLDAAEVELMGSSEGPGSFLTPEVPLADLAREYLDLLLAGERAQASRLIQQAVDDGVAVKDIYLHVFQRTQHEVGRLWQINQISVAHEHYCTAATQLIMSQLYPKIMSGEKTGRRLVMTCVNDELHELGARMVADFFEMEGWDTYYLGANTPTPDILSTLDEKQPDLLGISTTITYNLDQMSNLIEDVKASPLGEKIPVLVGGRPFNIDPKLYESIGADGQAPDAGTALRTADQMIQEIGKKDR